MRKVVFFAPLIALSLMASCANNNPIDVYYKFAFYGNYCSIDGNEKYNESIKENESKVFNVKADIYHALPEEITSIPSGVVYNKIDNDNATLTIPKMDHNYRVIVTASIKEIKVDFEAFRGQKAIDTVSVPSGTKWSEIIDKPTPTEPDYHFNGWSLEHTGAGAILDDDYVFIDDTTVYGSYDYICSLENAEKSSLRIANLEHAYGKDIVVNLAVKHDKTDKYELPKSKDNFTITTKHGTIHSDLYYYERGDKYAKLTISLRAQVDGEVKIAVNDYQPTYEVTVAKDVPNSHLKFFDEHAEAPSLKLADAKKGENYYFRIEAHNTQYPPIDIAYYIPSDLKIYVGKSTIPLDPQFYNIEPSETYEGFPIAATVSVNKSVINGPISIDADACQIGYYQYEILGLAGIKSQSLKYAYATDSTTIELELTEPETYGYPKAENIYVKIDGKKNEIKSIVDHEDIIEYDETNGHMVIQRNNNHAAFMFYVAADNYPFLENASWRDIDTISINGYAPNFFVIGETKSVTTIDENGNQDSYKARILDFNRDKLSSDTSKTAGITFDFTETIKNFTTHWEDTGTCTNFPESTLNKCLMAGDESGGGEGAVYKIYKTIADDSGRLVDFMKTVSKDVKICTSEEGWHWINYDAKLFPGSQLEVWDYYASYKCYSKILHSAAKGVWYWLRTPNTGGGTARAISPEGGLGLNEDVGYYDFHVSPIFCI